MASQSLYRKWRSQTFSDLIGQEAVVRTLLNAVRDGRLAHAYLFCGPRGTGKTSAARLLAKAVNCANPKDGEPCNECVSCREIATGRSPDVIEIDAASNTGVDNIRDLRETVNLLGSGGKYKVYIVDEVHMLSTAAFNALLKTLEEPPPHIIFVLATTEAHKVLPTVVSRCQRFDFRRFSMRDIVARLNHVASGEGLELEPAAAELIARAAQGGMRDALSLLDQAMAYCGTRIDLERTRAMLGLADTGAIRRLVIAVAEGRAAEGLHLINELVATGADLRQLNAQLGEEWRALVLARAGADVAALMDRTDEEAKEIAALAARFSLDELAACARVFARNETPARGLPVPQLGLELSFLECIGIREHKGLPAGAQPAVQSPAPQQRQAQPRPVPPALPASPALPAAAAIRQPQAPPPAVAANAPMIQPAPIEELDLEAIERGAAAPAPDIWARDDRGDDTGVMPEYTRAAATPAVPEPDGWPSTPAMEISDIPETADGNEGDSLAVLLGEARGQWDLIKQVCKQKSISVAALLNSARPVEVEAGERPVLVLRAEHRFHQEKLREPKSRDAIEWALEQVLRQPVRVKLTAGPGNGSGNRSSGAGPGSGPGSGPGGGNGREPGGPARGAGPTRPAGALNGSASPVHNDGDGPAHSATPANGSGHDSENGAPAASNVRRLPAAERMAAPTAVREPAADYGGERMSYAAASNITPLRPSAARVRAPARSLEDEVRGDAVIQALMRTHGIELADVRPLTDADGGE
jgi:DNA polymerase-3 subunit gamma/tau